MKREKRNGREEKRKRREKHEFLLSIELKLLLRNDHLN
jgi:hypothetical protein